MINISQKILEKKVEDAFKRALDLEKIVNIKGNPRGLKGFPDRLVFADRIYFVEIKVGKSGGSYYKQTPMQKYWEKVITEAKGEYVLIDGLDQAKEFAEKIIRRVKTQ